MKSAEKYTVFFSSEEHQTLFSSYVYSYLPLATMILNFSMSYECLKIISSRRVQ
jgi:hypothetical protein